MKVVIAGCRDYTKQDVVEKVTEYILENWFKQVFDTKDIEIVCGMARGADTCGKILADREGWSVDPHPALWDKYGKGAGYIRNSEMCKVLDITIAFWDYESHGTRDMIRRSIKKGAPTYIFNINTNMLEIRNAPQNK